MSNLADAITSMESSPEGEAPRITKRSNDRSFKRLMETTQFVVNCMGRHAMDVGGPGWQAAIRVRLLHTTMRARLKETIARQLKAKGSSPWNPEQGLPLNQQQMATTLATFCPAPPLSSGKIGCMPLPAECEDYCALWRVIGFYLGPSWPLPILFPSSADSFPRVPRA